MRETAVKAVASQGTAASKPYPAWTDLLKQLGERSSGSSTPESRPREWQDLVADMIVGRNR